MFTLKNNENLGPCKMKLKPSTRKKAINCKRWRFGHDFQLIHPNVVKTKFFTTYETPSGVSDPATFLAGNETAVLNFLEILHLSGVLLHQRIVM